MRKKKVVRSREDIQREQQTLMEKSEREIDAIAAEFHAKLPRERAKATGGMYARYSSRFQDSIADQVRVIFEAALAVGVFIPRDHVYFDLAVRGWKDRRPGLTALRQAIKRQAFQVFLVFTTSRLFRRTYKALQFVEEELADRGIRGVFVKSNLDTAKDENWRTTFQLFAAMDEAQVRMYGAHVQAAHEGLFLRGMVCTSLPLGYGGEPVPGELTKRRRPRRRIIIEPETAPWIEAMFQWYVVDGKSLNQIARDLNDDDDAPAPNKSLTGLWTHELARKHLMNPSYRGFWRYGAKRTVWLSDKDYARQVDRDKPLKSGQFENLRIIPDELWYRAQQLLEHERGNSGRKSRDGDRQSRPRFLRGLFICPEHSRQLVVGGPHGRSLLCLLCRSIKAEKRPLFTHFNRVLARRLTCGKLADLVRADDQLVDEIVSACRREVESAQRPDPEALKHLRAQANKISATIDFNRRNPGETEDDQRRTEQLLQELQRQRTDALADLAAMESARNGEFSMPEPKEVLAMLQGFGETLAAAGSAENDDEMRTARRIIDELTGGRIELHQMGERKQHYGWLRGRFTVDVVSLTINKLTGVRLDRADGDCLEVVIDYRAPKLIDEQSEEAKRLWDQGLLNKEIAARTGWKRSYVTKLIHHWHDVRGLPRPDGRRRRARLAKKQVATPVYQRIADEAVRLLDEGLSGVAIAKQLTVSDATVGKADAWWHKSRGLPVPTAKDRKFRMMDRARRMLHGAMLLKDIADEFGYSPRGLKLALGKYLGERGETLPDGRTRRGNAGSGELANGHASEDAPTDGDESPPAEGKEANDDDLAE
ncbi:MAG: recombinase family protein [Planctomycetales bacterium]